ncbi:MAG TPA: arginine--tRNA ligase [Candidatus Dormibacteraeota bacterium]
MMRGDLEQELGQRYAAAVRSAFDLDVSVEDSQIRPSGRERQAQADYQSNAAMGLAKRLGRPSPAVAAAIVERLDLGDMLEPPRVEGPGFVNLTLRRDWLERQVAELRCDDRIGVALTEAPRRTVIDYSAANIAKEMHVGHLRSTIIGDSIRRLIQFRGEHVIAQNHIGDWGTPLGMLLEHLVDEDRIHGADHSISELNSFYQAARRKFDGDPAFQERSRRRVVALQAGDEATLALWHELVDKSLRYVERLYELLGVLLTPADIAAESFYNPMLPDVAEELESRGLASVVDGALMAFPPGFTGRDGRPVPLIVRKSDGGYTYDTTDLAAIRHRARDLHADDILYVVGSTQRLHLHLVFAMAREAGWLRPESRVEHVSFGQILGPDGKLLRTRSGESIRLVELLEEAIERAAAIVAERSELTAGERRDVARAVGVGAVKYADLSGDRNKDYVFDWDRMLAMDGNTSVYLQYANARVRSVIRRAGGEVPPGTPVVLETPVERTLGLKLARFPTAVESATVHLQPHRLCTYLYETAVAFSDFYEKCSILGAETEAIRASRLVLSELTSRVMVRGLDLLGIEAPERL